MKIFKKVIVGVAFSLLLPSISYSASSNQALGWEEQGVLLPDRTPVKVELDTGSENSSLGAVNIVPFDKGDEKWVRFVLQIPTGLTGSLSDVTFEQKIVRNAKAKGVIGSSHRQVVKMSLCLGTQVYQEEFSLKPPGKKGYNVSLGRSALQHIGAVDASRSNTVKPDCSGSAAKPSA
ncbi:RimK/LysX family protein [Pseudomonas sp. NPDC088368]|jgi:hypothetical protein|uniref:putative ATP-dependent zinc protease n=1 Tax=Pseudomonas sp. NPDC088368 TaxID=3364453 RepID=UPI003824A5FF